MLLLVAAIVALVWVNAPVGDSYERLWRTTLSLGSGTWGVAEDLRHWVNDGLMAFFFLVVGLEIKREILTGELRDRRVVALPVVAAVGGMVVPALIYLAINAGGDGAHGWAIAMPTDIAFTLGIVALASRRAPAGLRSFVLTLAIVDDLLTFAVIAVFYPKNVDVVPLIVSIGLGLALLVLARLRVWVPVVFAVIGVALWVAMHASGVPAALAGVVVGLLTPASPSSRRDAKARRRCRRWPGSSTCSCRGRASLILPLFALANAGVRLSSSALADAIGSRVSIGIAVGRVVGKIVGIGLATWVATRAGVARLPAGMRFAHVLGIAAAAGIAFTVSLFVTDLAFGARPELVLAGQGRDPCVARRSPGSSATSCSVRPATARSSDAD